MVSAAEQLAANLNFGAFAKAEELKKRIWFTLAALLVYRLGTYIPIPGINPVAFAEAFRTQSSGILGMINMFAGGAIERMAIFALNIMPYISASIIMQLMQSVVPSLEALKKEGEQGRKQLNQYTRYLTVVLAAFQAFGIAYGLEGQRSASGRVVLDPGVFFRLTTVATLVGGTMFLMWLGEQITARGVGNGTSLIIMAGIVAGLPSAIVGLLELSRQGVISWPLLVALLVLMLAVVAAIVFIERAQRRLLVQYPKRQMGNRMFQGDASHLAAQAQCLGRHSADLCLVAAAAADHRCRLLAKRAGMAERHRGGPGTRTAALSRDLCRPDRLLCVSSTRRSCSIRRRRPTTCAKYGGFLPGIRPGAKTAEYIDYVLTRITVVGAIYLVGRVRAAGNADFLRRGALLFRRYVAADCGQRDHGHGGADPEPSAGAPI